MFSYSRPDGCSDHDTPNTLARQAIEKELLEHFRLYGYQQITLPTLEYADLYNRQTIGGDLFYRLLSADFSESELFPREQESPDLRQADRVSELVLRPELTAPAIRWFVSRWLAGRGNEPLPARLTCAGQIFRDVDPSLEHFVESRQIGVELIGSDRRWGDLEMLTLACEAADKLRLPEWRLYLSHAGLYRRALEAMGVPEDHVAQVASQVEIAARLAREVEAGDDAVFLNYVRAFLKTHASRVPGDHPGRDDPAKLSADDWRTELTNLNETYLRELWQRPRLALPPSTVAKILELARLGGEAEDFFSKLDRLVDGDAVKREAEELRWLCDELRREGVEPRLTPARRGLAYYTGLTFEIHCPMGTSPETHVCGGGRYDRLPGWIQKRMLETLKLRDRSQTPVEVDELLNGVGLAFHLERLVEALAADRQPPSQAQVFVVALGEDLTAEAVRFAGRLRRRDVATWCQLPPPSGRVAMRFEEVLAQARRLGAHFAVFFDPDEQQGRIGLFDMASQQRETKALDAIVDHITTSLSERSRS